MVKGSNTCLFGRDWLQKIRLNWTVIGNIELAQGKVGTVLQQFSEVFDDQPGNSKPYYTSSLKKFNRPRPVPFALRTGVEQELERLKNLWILERVTTSSWAAPIVVVPKRGGLRICGDYKVSVNPYLDVDIHPLPKHIFATLSGGRYFSKIDLSNAY